MILIAQIIATLLTLGAVAYAVVTVTVLAVHAIAAAGSFMTIGVIAFLVAFYAAIVWLAGEFTTAAVHVMFKERLKPATDDAYDGLDDDPFFADDGDRMADVDAMLAAQGFKPVFGDAVKLPPRPEQKDAKETRDAITKALAPRYQDEYRDGDAGYVWPCGCSQHIGGDMNYCKIHAPAAPRKRKRVVKKLVLTPKQKAENAKGLAKTVGRKRVTR